MEWLSFMVSKDAFLVLYHWMDFESICKKFIWKNHNYDDNHYYDGV